jgi:hypothetical protein
VINVGKKKNAKKPTNGSKIAFSVANLEQIIGDAPLAEEEIERLVTPCRIHIHSKRKGQVDADGISAKAVIDGAVHAGILSDDSPKFVKEVTFSQEKSKKEETVLKFWRAVK